MKPMCNCLTCCSVAVMLRYLLVPGGASYLTELSEWEVMSLSLVLETSIFKR